MKKITPKIKSQIVTMYQSGLSMPEIAKELGISYKSVWDNSSVLKSDIYKNCVINNAAIMKKIKDFKVGDMLEVRKKLTKRILRIRGKLFYVDQYKLILEIKHYDRRGYNMGQFLSREYEIFKIPG